MALEPPDIGANLPTANMSNFNKAAADFEASFSLSTQTLMTWSQQLELSTSSVNRFSTALDLAAKNLAKIQAPGVNVPAGQMSPAMSQGMSAAMGTAMANVMSSPLMRGIGQAQNAGSGAGEIGRAGLGNLRGTTQGVTNLGQGLQGVGGAIGGKAGGALAGAGGAVAKFAGPIGIAIQVLQGVWATLKGIEAIQQRIHAEQRDALIRGPAVGSSAYNSSLTAVRSLNQDIEMQGKGNAFTSPEVTRGMMQQLMSTGKDLGNLRSFLTPEAMVGKDMGLLNPVGGLGGMRGIGRNAMNNRPDTMVGAPGLMATGFSPEQIGISLNKAVNQFGNFMGSPDGPKKAFQEAATEIREMKIRSNALGVSQTKYMSIQEELIAENINQVTSMKDVRDEMTVFSQSIEAGKMSVKELSDTFFGVSRKGLGGTMAQMGITGPAQADALRKMGMKEQASALEAAIKKGPQGAGEYQDILKQATSGAKGGEVAIALRQAREGVATKAFAGVDKRFAGGLLQGQDIGSADPSRMKAMQDAEAGAAGMRQRLAGGRGAEEAHLEQTRMTMLETKQTALGAATEGLRRAFSEITTQIDRAATAMTGFVDTATTSSNLLAEER